MNIEEFQDLVDTFGERAEDWPQDVRDSALSLLGSSLEARNIVDEAASLRSAFGAAPVHQAPPELAGRVVALAAAMDQWEPRQEGDRLAARNAKALPFLRSGLARVPRHYVWFALCFLAGLAVGATPALVARSLQLDLASLFAVVI